MRSSFALTAIVLCGAASPVSAQVRLPSPDGWTFSFAGNVGAFYVFESESRGGQSASPGVIVGIGHRGSAIRSGYLPAFAVFDASGTEGATALSVHFGLAPVVQTSGGHDDTDGMGSRIDLRQAYLTVGGRWGEVLAGREVGVFSRQSMLDDMTLFGTGATGGIAGNPGGTTLGHSGFGYIFPGFNAQFAYSSPRERPLQVTVAAFDPSANNGFDELVLPRLEGELSWAQGGALVWTSGLLQHERDTALDIARTAWGVSGGARLRSQGFTVNASTFAGRGIGTRRVFGDGRSADTTGADLRASRGYLAQVTWKRSERPLMLGASFGQSVLDDAPMETSFRTVNSAATVGAYLQATRSLRVVGEVTRATSSDGLAGTVTNRSIAVALGMLMFF